MQLPLFALIISLGLLLPNQSFARYESAKGSMPVGGSASYLDLEPAFVVNYSGVGKLRYLKTDIALRLQAESSAESQIRHHMPYIRHIIVMRLSRATKEELSSMAGKELLRQDMLKQTRNMLIREDGQHFVDDLLFNSLIVQR